MSLEDTVFRDAGDGLVERRDGPWGRVGILARRHPGAERVSQDAAAVVPLADGGLALVVADGVGGARGGELASQLATETVGRLVSTGETPLRERVMRAFEEANEAILALGMGAATTLAVVTIETGVARAYHAGDSEVWWVGNRGRVKYQTVSHSPVGYAVASGVLDEQTALFHEERHVISNHVGTREMRIDVSPPLVLAPLDTILLATDGLFDNLTAAEIVERIRRGPLDTALGALGSDLTSRMNRDDIDKPSKEDDVTLLLYRGPKLVRTKTRAEPTPQTSVSLDVAAETDGTGSNAA